MAYEQMMADKTVSSCVFVVLIPVKLAPHSGLCQLQTFGFTH